MKKLLLFLVLLCVFSCSVQKRKYQNGYFISWHKKHSKKESNSITQQRTGTQEQNSVQINTEKNIQKDEQTFASANQNLSSIKLQASTHFKFPPEDTCDVLILMDGKEINAKVIEINTSQIHYKRCDLPNGPLYVSNKSEFFMIRYANGTKEIITPPSSISTDQKPYDHRVKPLKKRSSLANLSFTFGMLGFYPLILAGGIVALITSFIQLQNISANPDLYGGERKARAGMIMGAISVFMWAAIIVLSIVL